MKFLNQTERKFPIRIKTTLRNKTRLPFGDEIKNVKSSSKNKVNIIA